jgi:MFS family permease
MMPFPAIIAGDLFSIEKRGKIQALFTAMWGLSAVLAPMLGAFFVEYASWRWIFFINIPICIVSVVLLGFYKETYIPRKSKIDFIGALLFASGISLLLLTTTVKQYMVAYAIGGVVAMLVFIAYERKQSSPIIPLSLLRNRSISWINVNGFLACASLFGTSSFVPLFLQKEGYSIFMSGLALLGMSFGWMAVAVPAGKWILRWGYARLLIGGNVILVISGAMLLAMKHGNGFWYVFGAMVVQGLAFGLISTVSTIGSQQLVEPNQKGVSTSLSLFSRNIGTAVCVTIMGAILNNATDFFTGINQLFLFGFVSSIFAFVSSFMIRRV